MPLPQAWGWLLLAPCCISTARPVQKKSREDTRAKLCQEGPVLAPARKTIITSSGSRGRHHRKATTILAPAGWQPPEGRKSTVQDSSSRKGRFSITDRNASGPGKYPYSGRKQPSGRGDCCPSRADSDREWRTRRCLPWGCCGQVHVP